MAADFFLNDAPFVVPAEFAAWQAAQQEATRLEYAARQAWYRAGK